MLFALSCALAQRYADLDFLLMDLAARDRDGRRVVVGEAPHERIDAGTTNNQLFDQVTVG